MSGRSVLHHRIGLSTIRILVKTCSKILRTGTVTKLRLFVDSLIRVNCEIPMSVFWLGTRTSQVPLRAVPGLRSHASWQTCSRRPQGYDTRCHGFSVVHSLRGVFGVWVQCGNQCDRLWGWLRIRGQRRGPLLPHRWQQGFLSVPFEPRH